MRLCIMCFDTHLFDANWLYSYTCVNLLNLRSFIISRSGVYYSHRSNLKTAFFWIIFWGTSDLRKKAIPLSVYTSELCLAINYKKKPQTDYISFLPHRYKKKNPSRYNLNAYIQGHSSRSWTIFQVHSIYPLIFKNAFQIA